MAFKMGGIEGLLTGILTAVILLLVLIGVIVASLPIMVTYFGYLASNMTANNVSFAEFFNSAGLVYLLLGAVIVITVFGALFLVLRSMQKGGR